MHQFVNYIKQNWIQVLFSFLISCIGIALFYINISLLRGQLSTTTKISLVVYGLVIPVMLLFFYTRKYALNKKEKRLVIAISILISQFITLGSYADAVDFVSICFASAKTTIVWLCQSLLYTYIAYYFVRHIIYELQYHKISKYEDKINLKIIFCSLLIINIILIFLIYPCVFDFDGAIGLRTYLNPNDIKSNHHPYFIQMIHGFFWKLGKAIGNPSIGFAILTAIFCAVSSAILTYGASLLSKYGIGRKNLMFILVLIPIYISLSHLPTKDGFFAYAFLCYTITVSEIILSRQECLKSIKFITIHFLSIVFVCLSRNQGVYIIIVESVVLLLYCYHNILRISTAIIPAITIVILFNKVYLPSQNVVPSGRAEMFGTLFQQTALYSIRHPNDITSDERKIINTILPIEKAKNAYQPHITDDVKGCYCQIGQPGVIGTMPDCSDGLMHFSDKRVVNEKTKLKNYLSVWFSMLLRHPMTYIDAAFAINYGFFYNKGEMLYFLAWEWPTSRATTPKYAFYQNVKVHQFVNAIYGYAVHIPVINWIASIPYYIWLFLIICFVLLFRKDWEGFVLLIPSILSFCVLLVCPVCNARYMYPILVCIPIFIFYTLLTNKNNISNE